MDGIPKGRTPLLSKISFRCPYDHGETDPGASNPGHANRWPGSRPATRDRGHQRSGLISDPGHGNSTGTGTQPRVTFWSFQPREDYIFTTACLFLPIRAGARRSDQK